jgi:hypothetical protein
MLEGGRTLYVMKSRCIKPRAWFWVLWICFFMMLESSRLYGIVTVSLEDPEVLPRSKASFSFQVKFVIRGLVQNPETPDLELLRLRILIPEHSGTFRIPFEETGTDEDKARVEFLARVFGDAEVLEEADNSFTLTGSVVISATNAIVFWQSVEKSAGW